MRFHLPAFMNAEIKGEYRWGMAFALTHLSDYTVAGGTAQRKTERSNKTFSGIPS